MSNAFEIAGDVSLFGLRALTDVFRRPFEGDQLRRQLAEVGSKSLPLVVASGFALGAVLTLHTRSTLVTFGATAWIPTVQALAFFVEIGPLVTGLLVAGRVGSGIGAVLSNMRATEQIDAIESLSIDSFKYLVVPRIVACTIAMPHLDAFPGFLRCSRRVSLRVCDVAAFFFAIHLAFIRFLRVVEFLRAHSEDGSLWIRHRNYICVPWLHDE